MAPNTEKPVIIAIMGCTGVGKSTFIKTSGAQSVNPDDFGCNPTVGDGLESCTAEPQIYQIPQTNIYFIDTPGFNDTNISDREMLRRISTQLANLHAQREDIAGILYLHPITHERLTGSAKKNLDMFAKVVGPQNMSRCTFVTTKWSKEDPTIAANREKELIGSQNLWKPMFDRGVKYARFGDSSASVMQIISPLCEGKTLLPQVVKEWTQDKTPLHLTQAGRAVEDDAERAKEAHTHDLKEVEKEYKDALRQQNFEAARALEAEKATLKEHLDKMEKERELLRVQYENDKKETAENYKKEMDAYRGEQNRRQNIEKQKRENKLGRWAGRIFVGGVGAGVTVLTGGLAAPLALAAYGAAEAAFQDERQKDKRR
ncbi:hypothetical protein B0O99DRAFT_515097 [Bisporella sp. PMI_857]|nr:hypothetical protein B0O99DRAFT_515097 [Bisporella sp. PMI_857]